jgi:hypothetical protein
VVWNWQSWQRRGPSSVPKVMGSNPDFYNIFSVFLGIYTWKYY